MSDKHCCGGCHHKATSDPASRNYSKETNNKAHSKSPYGDDEPSTNTTYK